MLSFANDIEIKAQDELNLKRALERSDILKSNYRMKINRIKTKAIVCSRFSENINIKMDEDALKQVPKFKHLGSIFTDDGENKEDIIQRVKEPKIIINNRKQLLCSNNLGLEMKRETLKSCIWRVALYGSETWALGKNEERVVNAFETRS